MAHSAMLLLALAAWERHPRQHEQRRLVSLLAQGVRRQQRPDGSLQICFDAQPGRLPDAGWQLYGGEAALALATAAARLGDAGLLASAVRCLQAYREAYRRELRWPGRGASADNG